MHVSPIEGSKGQAVFKAGGDNSYKTGTLKGWNWSLEWAKSGRRFPRVLVIWPETATNKTKQAFWTIAHTAMVEMLEFDKEGKSTGLPSDFFFVEAKAALEMFGKDPNDKQALFALADVLLHTAPILEKQPVAPQRVQRALSGGAMWEMTQIAKATGKVISEKAV